MWMDVKEGKWIYQEDPDAFIYFRLRRLSDEVSWKNKVLP